VKEFPAPKPIKFEDSTSHSGTPLTSINSPAGSPRRIDLSANQVSEKGSLCCREHNIFNFTRKIPYFLEMSPFMEKGYVVFSRRGVFYSWEGHVFYFAGQCVIYTYTLHTFDEKYILRFRKRISSICGKLVFLKRRSSNLREFVLTHVILATGACALIKARLVSAPSNTTTTTKAH